MRRWLNTLLRLAAGTYFVLTSLYCLLAFLPYTYFFLIKSPAEAWMPWFAHHQAALYWAAAVAATLANWRVGEAWARRDRRFLIGIGVAVAVGIYLTLRPFLPSVEDNRVAYWWSLAALGPLLAIALWKRSEDTEPDTESGDNRTLAYSAGLLIALVIFTLYALGARVRMYSETRTLDLHGTDAELTLWSLLSHLVVALVIVSVINLIFALAAKTAHPRWFRRAGAGALVFFSLSYALARFLGSGLSFGGWAARTYAGSLALGLTLLGCSLVFPLLDSRQNAASARVFSGRLPAAVIWWIALAASFGLAIAAPFLIGGADWAGFFLGTVTIIVWIAVSTCLLQLRPARAQYSALALLLVLTGSAVAYKTLQAGEIFWSRPLGATDDEISLALEAYGGHDSSFQLVHHLLGNGREEVCGDLCRILREYTNVRDAHTSAEVQLVDTLTPARGTLPNIFIFVVDSLRPDYLGAYNPRVTYTPNLDAFARDSVVLHHAYSQYAGTSLSEPVFWTGALLLHAHYLQPFSRLNALDKMLHTDHYRTMVSMDDVMTAILPPDDSRVPLDTDKKLWNELEIRSTLEQLRAALDAPRDPAQPVFLYTQPKNVHQFARNNVPSPSSQHWQSPAGMNARITYEVHWVDQCLGEFFSDLKRRGMYDNSIIIVTSDHGDATGEFGRTSHSTVIWPEVMHVPLIIHLPAEMRAQLVYDDTRPATATDIVPTLYYLLGHRPILENPLYGRPLFAETRQELDHYPRRDLLLASDAKAVYGILTADQRYLYATYDSPARSYLFDLTQDPNAEHNILTEPLKQHYDEEIIEKLQEIGDFYGYRPGMRSLVAAVRNR
ncbi:MAG: sulfatase-like hydrolase/transferase [Candidatus Sulfotelmatobacter sp.]